MNDTATQTKPARKPKAAKAATAPKAATASKPKATKAVKAAVTPKIVTAVGVGTAVKTVAKKTGPAGSVKSAVGKRTEGTRDGAKRTGAKQTQGKDTNTAKQGAGSVGTEMRGGAKQVLITEAVLEGRGGRPRGEEAYPFGVLTPAVKRDGKIVGPSFFIPMSDKANGKLAVARKRYPDHTFWSRRCFEQIDGKGEAVEGLRIWCGSPELGHEVAR